MLLVLLLVVSCELILGGLVGSKPYYDLDRAEEYFEQFIIAHDKEYFGDEHKQQTFEIFKQNLILINEKNAQDPHAVFGINKFSDLSLEEFLKHQTGVKPNGNDQDDKCERLGDDDVKTKDAPDEFDWRSQNAVTPIKNQKYCGSCWTFGTTGNIEGQYAIKNKKITRFSEQQIVDCDMYNFGCSGGYPLMAFSYIIDAGGLESEDDYVYVGIDDMCKFNQSKVVVKLAGCKGYNMTDEDKVKELLHSIGPLTIGVDAESLQHYTNGVSTSCTYDFINHSVLLVGYGKDNGQDYWLIKNSWGPGWGEKGYFRVKRGVNSCGMLEDYLITSVIA